MTFRKSTLAALLAVLALPAVASAASSGLSAAEIAAGQVPLLSQRTTTHEDAKTEQAQTARRSTPKAGDVSDVNTPEHQRAMETGLVRMTKGSMEGSKR